jgi:predicted acyl esterase
MRRVIASLASLLALGVVPGSAPRALGATAAPTDYVTMTDGTSIAVNVQFPTGAAPAGGWPTIIEIDGYGGASDPNDPMGPVFGNGNYATVHMSLRGTGCSGGNFDLFDRRSSQDGYEVIEWIAAQTWSNGKVAIWGHSYSGLTGWLVASTQPPHLVAMSVSGLIDDLYKGIVYMGGVSNLGFPLVWTGGYRPASEYSSGVLPGVENGLMAGDPTCLLNQAQRVPPDVTDNPIVNGVASLGEENQWWASHSTITYLDGINVPIHIVQTYQDEQTGPRGSNLLWQRLDERKPNLPKRLLLTNGVHSTNVNPPEIHNDRVAWLDCYVRGVCTGDITDPTQRVKVFWEMHNNGSGTLVSNGVTAASDWPLPITNWTRYYFGSGNTLSTDASSVGGAPDAYVSGSKRAGAWTYLGTSVGVESSNLGAEVTTANLPDEVRYQTAPLATDTALAGPIDVTLFASSTAPDTEFYVELNDIDADGNMTRLQRGMLKASHRAIDPYRTDYNAAGDIIRPYHPDTNTTTAVVTPGTVTKYDIEVFPLGFVLRTGHRLVVRVTTPPINDSLATYIPTTAPGINFISHDAAAPSSILLPLVPASQVVLGPPIGCRKQVGLERCSKPVN